MASEIIDFDFSKLFLHIMHDDGSISIYSTDKNWLKSLESCEHFTISKLISTEYDPAVTMYPDVFNIVILCNCSEDFITILKMYS